MLYLILIGIISGILGGMGLGGGTLLIPLLCIFFNFSQHIAQGINLIAFIPMSFISLYILKRKKLIKTKAILPIIMSGIIMCFVGFLVSKSIEGFVLRKIFGIFLIILSFYYFYNQIKNRKNN